MSFTHIYIYIYIYIYISNTTIINQSTTTKGKISWGTSSIQTKKEKDNLALFA